MLAWIATKHPGLRMVDFISFSARAQRLPDGLDWANPLYPVGYPAMLSMLQPMVGDVLWVGKGLSVLAGGLLIWAMMRWLGPWVGAWLAVQPLFVEWATTEGTDVAAVSLCLAGLACVFPAHREQPHFRGRWALAGALIGGACMVRYTSVVCVLVALVGVFRCGRTAAKWFVPIFVLVTAPHWAVSLFFGEPLLPDQSINFAIGAGHPVDFWSFETITRWPEGFGRALGLTLQTWPTRLGCLGLVLGMGMKDRRAWALSVFSLLHLALLGLAFVNPRLALPALLTKSLGVFWFGVLAHRWSADRSKWTKRTVILLQIGCVGAMALWGFAWNPLPPHKASPAEEVLTDFVQETEGFSGRALSTSPHFYRKQGGWVQPVQLMRAIAPQPHQLTPERLWAEARAKDFSWVVVDVGRVRRTYPGLAPLLERDLPSGFSLLTKEAGWRALQILESTDP